MKVGSLVECINDAFTPDSFEHIPHRPVRGQHYFVRAIYEIRGTPGIHLEEIVNPPKRTREGSWKEPTFKVERFREIEGLDMAIEELLEESLLVDI